jgi:hypothetical protein
MTPAALEEVYELLAEAIDSLPAEAEAAFLARLALVLANECDDVDVVKTAIKTALVEPGG